MSVIPVTLASPGIAMDIDDAGRFRRQAEICREESNKARSAIDAVSWLRLADDFEKLAERDGGQGSATSAPHAGAPEVGPYIGTASAAGLTDKAGFNVGKP